MIHPCYVATSTAPSTHTASQQSQKAAVPILCGVHERQRARHSAGGGERNSTVALESCFVICDGPKSKSVVDFNPLVFFSVSRMKRGGETKSCGGTTFGNYVAAVYSLLLRGMKSCLLLPVDRIGGCSALVITRLF